MSYGLRLHLLRRGRHRPIRHRSRLWRRRSRRRCVFLVVYTVALTTFLPALRASRIYPAQALRYQ